VIFVLKANKHNVKVNEDKKWKLPQQHLCEMQTLLFNYHEKNIIIKY